MLHRLDLDPVMCDWRPQQLWTYPMRFAQELRPIPALPALPSPSLVNFDFAIRGELSSFTYHWTSINPS